MNIEYNILIKYIVNIDLYVLCIIKRVPVNVVS